MVQPFMHRSQIDSSFFSAPPIVITPPPSTTESTPSPVQNLSSSTPLDLSPSASPVSSEIDINIDDAGVEAWDVEQVVDFVNSVPGCAEYAEVSPDFHSVNFVKKRRQSQGAVRETRFMNPCIRVLWEFSVD